jgi:hypothetical protein
MDAPAVAMGCEVIFLQATSLQCEKTNIHIYKVEGPCWKMTLWPMARRRWVRTYRILRTSLTCKSRSVGSDAGPA